MRPRRSTISSRVSAIRSPFVNLDTAPAVLLPIPLASVLLAAVNLCGAIAQGCESTFPPLGTKPHPVVTHHAMRSWPGVSVLPSVVWNSLAGIFILLPFSAIAQAGQSLFLDRDPPSQCGTLTVTWPRASPNPSFYGVEIVDNDRGQPIFQANVMDPTNSVAWVLNATAGTSLHLAIHTPSSVNSNDYAAADFRVHAGPSTCFSSEIVASSTSSTPLPSPSTPAPIVSPSPSLPVSLTSTTKPPSSSPSNFSLSLSATNSSPSSSLPMPPATASPTTSPGSPTTSAPRLSAGSAAGISVGMCTLVAVLALVSFWYIKRGRSGGRAAYPNPSIVTPTDRGEERSELENEASTRTNSSLVAWASDAGSSVPYHAGESPHAHEEGIDRAVTSEKLLRGLANIWTATISTPDGRNGSAHREREGAIEVPVSGIGSEQHEGARREANGDVRLAGGTPGDSDVVADSDSFDQRSTSEVSTLPPPYSSRPTSDSGRM